FGEWHFRAAEADGYEVRLLLAETLHPRLFWVANLSYEREPGNEHESELGLSQALIYSLIGKRLGAGAEMKVGRMSENGVNGFPRVAALIGPSVQWRPLSHLQVRLAPLAGLTKDSPRVAALALLEVE